MFANNSNYNVRPILYYDDINPHSRAVLMILNMLDVDIELRAVEMIKGEHLKPAYAKINPAHTVPTMVHKDLVITGNAIFSYVCENNDNEKANQLIALKCYKRHCCVLSRLFFESQVLHRIHGHLMTDLVRKTIFQTDLDYHQRKVEHAYDVMEAYLAEGQFMAGAVLTAADISFVACLGALDMMFPIDGDRKRWEKLNDWYRRMRSLSIQKINEFGIEKQRQIVEYFAKFQFKSDIKRFTTGLRESQIPSFPSRPDRCSVSIQTGPVLTATGKEPTVDILSTQHNIGKITYLQDQTALPASGERNAPVTPNALKDGVAPKIFNEINKIAKTKISKILNEELEKELALFTEPDFPPPPIIEAPNPLETLDVPILSDVEKSVSSSKTTEDETTILKDRSLGGAHKEKPPVPPKRKRNAPAQEADLKESNNAATNVHNSNETEATVDPTKLIENSALCTTTEKQECDSVPQKYAAPSQPHQLSRLNGGVESTILIEMENNQIQIQPPAAFSSALPKIITDWNSIKPNSGNLSEAPSLISASNSNDVHKLSQKPAKTRIALNSTKTNSHAKNNVTVEMATTETLLPEGVPINGQQVALSYTRGAAAPNFLLAAPPPSPENHSQDEEFPPPPSELLIPKPTPRTKTTPNPRLPNIKAMVDANERFGKKKIICGKPKTDIVVECTAKLGHKRSCELRSLTGRKYPAQESKVCKLAKKLNNGGLFASGTRSLCSNPSQRSIPRERCKRVSNLLNIIKPIPKLVRETKVSPPVAPLDKKTQKVKNVSAGTLDECSDSSTNCIQKLFGHNCSEPKQLNNQSTEEQPRVEGGGQWTTSPTADGNQKALNSLLQQPTIIVVKSKTMMKMEDENEKNEERWQHNNSTKSTKPRPKTPPHSVTKDMTANQNLASKNKQKAYPTQIRFQAKNFKISTNPQPAKFFDTSPYKPGQSFNKQQSKLVAEKKNKKKKLTKAHNNVDLSNKTQAPLNEGLPTPRPVVDQNAAQQSTPEQIATPPSAVGTVSSTLKTLTETIHISPNVTSSPTSNTDDTIVADVPIKVGLVAKALQTLNVATLNFRPPTYNISKELTPTKPLLPPPPPPNHGPLATVPPPPPLPVKDILPQAGTVAKALQSLSAVTSDANPLCGSVKPFRKADLKMKFMDSARLSVVTDKGLNRTVPFNDNEKHDARPLAEILIATVKQMNQKNFDEPKSTTLSEGIKEMLLKMKTLPDKDMLPVDLVNSMTESTKPFQSARITSSTSVIIGLKNSKDKITVDSESNKPLLPTQQLSNMEDFSDVLVPPTICEPVQVLVPQKKKSISEPHDVAKSYPSWAACTDTTILSASEVKSSKEEKNKLEASKTKRYALDRNMINDGIIDMEPTPLPGQPNIIITGYTRAEPKGHNPVYVGTGRTLGNVMPPTLRRPTNVLCTHGPSANVVISTFGYTPMPDLDTIPENLMHLMNKPLFNEQQIAPPPPSVLSTAAAAQQVTAVSDERVLAARRPYPTAHRSDSQRRANQQINIRGRVM